MLSIIILAFMIGAGISILHNIPVDKPPPSEFFKHVIAGGLGGVVGMLLVHNLDTVSSAVPGYLAAAATGLVFSTATTISRR